MVVAVVGVGTGGFAGYKVRGACVGFGCLRARAVRFEVVVVVMGGLGLESKSRWASAVVREGLMSSKLTRACMTCLKL